MLPLQRSEDRGVSERLATPDVGGLPRDGWDELFGKLSGKATSCMMQTNALLTEVGIIICGWTPTTVLKGADEAGGHTNNVFDKLCIRICSCMQHEPISMYARLSEH